MMISSLKRHKNILIFRTTKYFLNLHTHHRHFYNFKTHVSICDLIITDFLQFNSFHDAISYFKLILKFKN